MKTILHTDCSKKSGFLKIINVLFLALILISNSSFASRFSSKESEDSNKVVKHTPSDDKDAVKISLPNTKLVNRADREIHLNMERLIREYTNPILVTPDMLEADKEMNNAFFSNYKISFNSNTILSDEDLNSLFFAYNLMMPSANLYGMADDEINFEFFIENYLKINADLLYAGDSSINVRFNNENAE